MEEEIKVTVTDAWLVEFMAWLKTKKNIAFVGSPKKMRELRHEFDSLE